MERKDLIFMASESGFGKLLTGDGLPTMWHGADLKMLERFADLVAAAEREACANLCSKLAHKPSSLWQEAGCWTHSAQVCAETIMERSNAEVSGRAA